MKYNKTKILRLISLVILIVAFLCIYAFSVRHVVLGGNRFGFLTKPIRYFIEFPSQVSRVFKEQLELPTYHIYVDTSFTEVNTLENDIFALNAHFEKDKYVYVLSNLRNDSILHSWSFTKENYKGSAESFKVSFPLNPILLDDGSMIGMLNVTKNLFRLDKESNIVWQNTSKIFHHSLNISHDKNVWVCSMDSAYTKNEVTNITTMFQDDFLTKVDLETGDIVFDKSLSEILISNGYLNLVHGYCNGEESGIDMFHLNDIQPILVDGEFWKKGDLLLSLRHRSMIILYRPETNKILRIISGPFLFQHDVDVISENEISIFNNNRAQPKSPQLDDGGINIENATSLIIKSSDIVVYNFSDSTFSKPFLSVIQKEKIYTNEQGTQTFLSNGDLFIESTMSGKIYILRDDKVILRRYANRPNENGTTEYPHWMRIYEKVKL